MKLTLVMTYVGYSVLKLTEHIEKVNVAFSYKRRWSSFDLEKSLLLVSSFSSFSAHCRVSTIVVLGTWIVVFFHRVISCLSSIFRPHLSSTQTTWTIYDQYKQGCAVRMNTRSGDWCSLFQTNSFPQLMKNVKKLMFSWQLVQRYWAWLIFDALGGTCCNSDDALSLSVPIWHHLVVQPST